MNIFHNTGQIQFSRSKEGICPFCAHLHQRSPPSRVMRDSYTQIRSKMSADGLGVIMELPAVGLVTKQVEVTPAPGGVKKFPEKVSAKVTLKLILNPSHTPKFPIKEKFSVHSSCS